MRKLFYTAMINAEAQKIRIINEKAEKRKKSRDTDWYYYKYGKVVIFW